MMSFFLSEPEDAGQEIRANKKAVAANFCEHEDTQRRIGFLFKIGASNSGAPFRYIDYA